MIAGCTCAGNCGNVFPATDFKRKPLVNDPGTHHGTCVTHVPCCISGSHTSGGRENVLGIPSACATHNSTYLVRSPCVLLRLFLVIEKCQPRRLSQFYWQFQNALMARLMLRSTEATDISNELHNIMNEIITAIFAISLTCHTSG